MKTKVMVVLFKIKFIPDGELSKIIEEQRPNKMSHKQFVTKTRRMAAT